MISDLTALRRSLAAAGITPASVIPPASAGRREEADIHLAQLLEGDVVEARAVGEAVGWPDPVAFLDGVQHSEVVGYAGASPIVVASFAAAVRERMDRILVTRIVRRRDVAIGRRAALDAAGRPWTHWSGSNFPTPTRRTPYANWRRRAPPSTMRAARSRLPSAWRYRSASRSWLMVDGSLAESPVWAADARMVGVAKSHSSLPFDGANLESYLRLPPGHRSPIFAPASAASRPCGRGRSGCGRGRGGTCSMA